MAEKQRKTESKGPLQMLDGFRVTAELPERTAQVQLGAEIVRRSAHDTLQVRNPFGDAARLAQQAAQADVGVQVTWCNSKCLPEVM